MGEEGDTDNKETVKRIHIDFSNKDIIVNTEDDEDEEQSGENKENIFDVEDKDDPYKSDIGCREDFSVHFCPVCPCLLKVRPILSI